MLALDGVFVAAHGKQRFRDVAAPDAQTLRALLDRIITRIFLCLERDALLVRNPEQPWLDLETGLETEDALDSFGAASIQYRIAVGPDAGQKALTLKRAAAAAPSTATVTKPFTVQRDGFSLPLYRRRGPWRSRRINGSVSKGCAAISPGRGRTAGG